MIWLMLWHMQAIGRPQNPKGSSSELWDIHAQSLSIRQKRYISPRMKSVNTPTRIHFLILVQDCGVLLGIRHERFSTIYHYCVAEPWFSRRLFLGISALLCPITTTSYAYSRRVSQKWRATTLKKCAWLSNRPCQFPNILKFIFGCEA